MTRPTRRSRALVRLLLPALALVLLAAPAALPAQRRAACAPGTSAPERLRDAYAPTAPTEADLDACHGNLGRDLVRDVPSYSIDFHAMRLTLGQRHATGFLDRALHVAGTTWRYQVYVPTDYDPSRAWPVILFLHGIGERGTDGLRQTQIGVAAAIRRDRDAVPAIVVFPQVPPDSTWLGEPARVALMSLDSAMAEFHGDPERVYLTGLSMGGFGAWLIAFRHPERFAALVPVCGGIVHPSAVPELHQIPETIGAADPYAMVAARVKGIPIWIFHGAADPVIPPDESRRMYAALGHAGADVHYTEYPGVGHDSWTRAYAEPELWRWLFAQHRTPHAER